MDNEMMISIYNDLSASEQCTPLESAAIAEYACRAYSQNLYNMKGNENAFSFYKTMAFTLVTHVADAFGEDVEPEHSDRIEDLNFENAPNCERFIGFYLEIDRGKVEEVFRVIARTVSKQGVPPATSEVPDA